MATHSFKEIDIPEGKYLKDLVSMQVDMQFAKKWIEKYQEMICTNPPDYSFGDVLTIASLVNYCRVFKSGVRENLFKKLEQFLNTDQIKQHNFFISLRDKHISHSVNDYGHSLLVARFKVESLESEGIYSVACNHDRVIALGLKDLDSLCNLVNKFLKFVEVEIEKEQEKLLPIVRERNLEEISVETKYAGKGPVDKPRKK